jgi:beta-galactosidase
MKGEPSEPPGIPRRDFLRTCALSGAALAVGNGPRRVISSVLRAAARESGANRSSFGFDTDWLFGGELKDKAALQPGFDDSAYARVSLPHCVTKLSWQNWNPASWERLWVYRRHFEAPEPLLNQRAFLHFAGVMVGATPVLNGHALPKHLGGYLPFEYEITNLLRSGENVLAVALDSRWSNAPPEGSPVGPRSIDYLEPGGIVRSIRLFAAPRIFLSDVFAKPTGVLDGSRRVEVACSIDAAAVPSRPMRIEAALKDGERVLARDSQMARIEKAGVTEVALTLAKFGNVALWDVDSPRLYSVEATLSEDGKPVDVAERRIGFRDARFEVDGFFLNGKRFRIFGLDRHELFPYVGFAMPPRVLRHDAEILRRDFNCNFVRCSHYPQSEAFLDACDELGLMVWEELPGWHYLGDASWQDLAVRDVKDMVTRDRNHPAVVIWGVRINESANDPALYRKTKSAADALDGSRPTSGTMTRRSTENWLQDVFAYDDYHAAADGAVDIAEPLPGVPYFVTETVGQFDYAAHRGFDWKYQRARNPSLQEKQAILHAQAHDRGAAWPRLAGVVAWCAFDYGSLINSQNNVKRPGIADLFRIPKLGASFYLSQIDPKIRPVIEPDFYWDFGPETPSGPGKNAAIFSNCDRLEIFVNGKSIATARPDRKNFPRLKYPPFFADLDFEGAGHPELRIDGYVGRSLALSRSFSSDRAQDRLLFRADDNELVADGSDATRVAFQSADRFGAPRPFTTGLVTIEIDGPGIIVGDNPFDLGASGGAGAVWIKTVEGKTGRIRVFASHTTLGTKSLEIRAVSPAKQTIGKERA